ncbi:MAG: hypothetical protein LM556_00025 [Desulfurococcaceae archaeon]|nr:hypothetical protein [Desulfurococcaceae archaeon]
MYSCLFNVDVEDFTLSSNTNTIIEIATAMSTNIRGAGKFANNCCQRLGDVLV